MSLFLLKKNLYKNIEKISDYFYMLRTRNYFVLLIMFINYSYAMEPLILSVGEKINQLNRVVSLNPEGDLSEDIQKLKVEAKESRDLNSINALESRYLALKKLSSCLKNKGISSSKYFNEVSLGSEQYINEIYQECIHFDNYNLTGTESLRDLEDVSKAGLKISLIEYGSVEMNKTYIKKGIAFSVWVTSG